MEKKYYIDRERDNYPNFIWLANQSLHYLFFSKFKPFRQILVVIFVQDLLGHYRLLTIAPMYSVQASQQNLHFQFLSYLEY